jgi:predicted AlkP superfamily pyrophosphatase or phosphodiesterase
MKKGALVVGVILLILGAGFSYTALPPYEMPSDLDLTLGKEFVSTVARRAGDRTVVVFVFDGFAPALLEAANTPYLDRIELEGVYSRDMMPVFPSLSLPNHFSLTTGCYPERHGVVSNHFRDPKQGIYHTKGDADWLLACEPLNVVAERQGVRAAMFGWVGNTSSTRGKLASVAEPFVRPPPDGFTQAEKIIKQLRRPVNERPGLIAAYVTEPDTSCHEYGLSAPEARASAHDADRAIGRVMRAIERDNLRSRVTLIVTTDHGMVASPKMVKMERVVRDAGIDAEVYALGTSAHLHLKDPARKSQAIEALSRYDFLDVIDPADPPAYARIGRSARVGHLMIGLHEGYWAFDMGFWPWYLRWSSWSGEEVIPSGRFKAMHGYNPEAVPAIRGIFYAWGFEIRPGVAIDKMRTVDVHPTVAHLLGIGPGNPHDGRARTDIIVRPTPGSG